MRKDDANTTIQKLPVVEPACADPVDVNTYNQVKAEAQYLKQQLDEMTKTYNEMKKIKENSKRDKQNNDSSQSSTLTVKTKEINVVFNLDFPVGFLKDNRILAEFFKRSGNRIA